MIYKKDFVEFNKNNRITKSREREHLCVKTEINGKIFRYKIEFDDDLVKEIKKIYKISELDEIYGDEKLRYILSGNVKSVADSYKACLESNIDFLTGKIHCQESTFGNL